MQLDAMQLIVLAQYLPPVRLDDPSEYGDAIIILLLVLGFALPLKLAPFINELRIAHYIDQARQHSRRRHRHHHH
jgi:hypothetical protein